MSARSPYVVLALALLAALLVVGLTVPSGDLRSAAPVGEPPEPRTPQVADTSEPSARPDEPSGSATSGTTPGDPETGGSSSAPGEDDPTASGTTTPDAAPEPADPLTADVVAAPERAVTETIGDRGGSLSATGADGTTYALELPPGAVATGIPVTMTPVEDVTGVPGERLLGAVVLEPDGLVLGSAATLVVTPGEPAPVDRQTGFAAGADGADFHLTPLDPVAVPTLQVHSFGTVGAWLATAQQRDAVAERRPAAADARLEAALAPVALADRSARLRDDAPADLPSAVRDVLADHDDRYVAPALDGRLPTLADGMTAVADATLLLQHYDDLGLQDAARTEALRERLATRLVELVERAADGCEDTSLRTIQYLLALDRQYRQLVDEPDDRLAELVEGCARFRVELRTDVRDAWDYTSPQEAHRLQARWRLRARTVVGADGAWTAPLEAVGYRYDKTVRRSCTGGPDRVSRWEAAPVDRQPTGRVRGRVVIDRNLYRGGVPESGGALEPRVEVRVVRAPEQRIEAATFAGCSQAVADRYGANEAQFADRFDVLFDSTPDETTFTAPLRNRPRSDGTLGSWSGEARSADKGIDRTTTGAITLRLLHAPGGLSG